MLFFIIVTVLVASANAKFYTDCGSTLATVHDVTVSGCAQDADRCVLQRSSNVTITINFTPTQAVKTLEAIAYGTNLGVPMPFPVPQPDACKDSGLNCPLAAGQVANYETTLPILQSYPKVAVDVKFELQNENYENVVCVTITAKIR